MNIPYSSKVILGKHLILPILEMFCYNKQKNRKTSLVMHTLNVGLKSMLIPQNLFTNSALDWYNIWKGYKLMIVKSRWQWWYKKIHNYFKNHDPWIRWGISPSLDVLICLCIGKFILCPSKSGTCNFWCLFGPRQVLWYVWSKANTDKVKNKLSRVQVQVKYFC